MLTLFSVPKPFRGHVEAIQKNAIRSWTQLSPPSQVILFGDESGVAEAASEFGITHVPQVERNDYGTPLLDNLFEKAEAMATNDTMCYVNGDIILMNDFTTAIERVRRIKKSFLMVGRRWDVQIDERVDLSQPGREVQLRAYVREYGKPREPDYIDFFVFPRGFFRGLLPFAIGRAAFDNWLLWKAR
ncbi:MAG TPA: hypothetical protein VJK02_11925, partial [Anaerolineales bacterium]|nr:hypothetical protein [Anaerolineales bacterium]